MKELVYVAVNLLLLGWLAYQCRQRIPAISTRHYLPALVAKLVAGIGVGLLYSFYYSIPGDTFLYFEDAQRITNVFYDSPKEFFSEVVTGSRTVDLINNQPRAIFFVRLVAVVNLVTGNNYWLSSLWFSFFSFAGTWYLVARLQRKFPDALMVIALSFLFFPTVVLWSSGIVKESVAFGSLCFTAGFFLHLVDRIPNRWQDYAWLAVSSFLLLSLKYYWAAVLFPAMLTSLLISFLPGHNKWKPVVLVTSWLLLFCFLCGTVSLLHPNFYLGNFLEVIKLNHDAFVGLSQHSLYIRYYHLEASWFSLAINAPWALVSGLFRPFLFEVRNMPQIFTGLENLFLMVLFLFQISRLRVPRSEHRLLFMACVGYIVIVCIFLSLSTPNFGTLSRYRIGFLPFFALLLMLNTPSFRGKSFRKIISQLRPSQRP